MTFLRYTWALPMLLLGVVVELAFRAVGWRADGQTGEWMHVKGPVADIMFIRGWRGCTIGLTRFYWQCPNMRLTAHEQRHTWQATLLGPLFLPVYLVLLAFYGYRSHPLERDAREYAERIAS